MRRPLLLVCLCLVIAASLRLLWDADDVCCKSGGKISASRLAGPKQLTLTGRVYKKDRNQFYLDSIIIHEGAVALQHENPKQSFELAENLLCEYDQSSRVRLGSRITVTGCFVPFSGATNPGEFDQRAYYQVLHIGGKLKQIQIISEQEAYSRLAETLYQQKEYWKERLYQIFPQKEASVMCTMLLGESKETDEELKSLYKRNGMIHILSISGLHITIVGISLYHLLRKIGIPIWLAAVIGGGIILLYGFLTGMSISATRAIGMYLLKMLSHILGRTYDMLTALGVLGAVMTLINPRYLTHAGFLLSFSAVLGIGVLYPALWDDKRNKKPQGEGRFLTTKTRHGGTLVGIQNPVSAGIQNCVPSGVWQWAWSGIKKSLLAGLSISLTTLPVLLWFYYEVPVYSMLLNLIVLPFMSMVLCFGMLAMLLPGMGILGTVDCMVLGLYEWLCRLFDRLPFHTWNPGRPKVWQMVLYYGIWLLMVCLLHAFRERKGLVIKNVRILAPIMMVMVMAIKLNSGSVITFLDVGQGDCICVQTASGEVYLFDCGSSSRKAVGKYVLLPFLKYNGIQKIDGVFISHEDMDHKNGIEELLGFAKREGITIKQVVLPGTILAGEMMGAKKASLLCLHPSDGYDGVGNQASQCFYVELWNDKLAEHKVTLLLTGDVEGEGERALTEQLRLYGIEQSTVLKVSHHGSRNATSKIFLRQLKPQLAVISCGRNNRYGHPHEEMLERLQEAGTEVFRTDETGAIEVRIKGDKVMISVYG